MMSDADQFDRDSDEQQPLQHLFPYNFGNTKNNDRSNAHVSSKPGAPPDANAVSYQHHDQSPSPLSTNINRVEGIHSPQRIYQIYNASSLSQASEDEARDNRGRGNRTNGGGSGDEIQPRQTTITSRFYHSLNPRKQPKDMLMDETSQMPEYIKGGHKGRNSRAKHFLGDLNMSVQYDHNDVAHLRHIGVEAIVPGAQSRAEPPEKRTSSTVEGNFNNIDNYLKDVQPHQLSEEGRNPLFVKSGTTS